MFDIYQIMRSLPLLAAILFDRHLEKIYSFADWVRVARLSAGVFWNSRAFSTIESQLECVFINSNRSFYDPKRKEEKWRRFCPG